MTAAAFHTLLHLIHLSLQVLILFLVIRYTRIIRKRNNDRRP